MSIGPNWYDRAEDELTEDYNNGLISLSEFNRGMRDLRAEFQEAADQAAEDARDAYYGGGW